MRSDGPLDIGSRLELMVDEYLIDHTRGDVGPQLHRPSPKDVVLVFDRPWEGNMSACYATVIQDGSSFRLYYQALAEHLGTGKLVRPHPLYIGCAESEDGLHWVRPELGLHEFEDSKKNNIVWQGDGAHGFAPFRDTNPQAAPEARYKAVGCANQTLLAFISPDGLRWSRRRDEPIITRGKFDSQNLAFWDGLRGEYRAYTRDFRDERRDIRTATSPDFVHWTDPVWLEYPASPDEQLYTNQIQPYYRAPHLFVGFPTRYVERPWSAAIEALPELEHRRIRAAVGERYGTAVTDGLFMTSRDGQTFKRWGEAFLRPGPQAEGNWAYGDNYQSWGLIETPSHISGAPRELSLYASENYWRGKGARLRRYTLRVDGFVSMNAALCGGEFITRPLRFDGDTLLLNLATSAAGSIRVEIQNGAGTPIPGFSLDQSVEAIGDALEYPVRWASGADLRPLTGQPVRLRFVMKDADLYALRFATRRTAGA